MEILQNTYSDIIIRCVVVYVFMLVALRVFGKKELSQLNTFDIILILLISSSVQNAMVGTNSTLTGGLAAAAVLFTLNFVFKKLKQKSGLFDKIFSDKAEILIHNGKPDFKTLARLDIGNDELLEAMREHGVEHYLDVKLAMLEPDGNISIISGERNLKQTHFKRHRSRKNLSTVQ